MQRVASGSGCARCSRQTEEQVKQWAQENMFEGKRISLEQTRTIADIILRSLESVQKSVK